MTEDIRESLVSSLEGIKERVENAKNLLDEIDPLDVKATISLNGSITEMYLVLGTGGPHIELELHNNTLVGYWGNEEVRRRVDSRVSDELWEYFEWQFEERC